MLLVETDAAALRVAEEPYCRADWLEGPAKQLTKALFVAAKKLISERLPVQFCTEKDGPVSKFMI